MDRLIKDTEGYEDEVKRLLEEASKIGEQFSNGKWKKIPPRELENLLNERSEKVWKAIEIGPSRNISKLPV